MAVNIERDWICTTTCIATKTVLVKAKTRKEAIEKLKVGKGEGIDVNYGTIRSQKVICEDKKS